MGKGEPAEKPGALYGRPDIERCDLFIDLGFMNWGKYPRKINRFFNEDADKGRQMLPGVPPTKCGLQGQSGYFDSKFKRGFDKDKYVDQWRLDRGAKTKPLFGEWIPVGATKKHGTPGDIYGTFVTPEQARAVSPAKKPKPPTVREKTNFITNPPKKGNAGYLDITINKYPEHSYMGKTDPYSSAKKQFSQRWAEHKKLIRAGPFISSSYPRACFDNDVYKGSALPTYVFKPEKAYGVSRGIFLPPSYPKKPGNNHDGCFDKFPGWKPEKYTTQAQREKLLVKKDPKHEGLVFYPETRTRSYYTKSVVNNKIDFGCNERTWMTMKPITYPQFNY